MKDHHPPGSEAAGWCTMPRLTFHMKKDKPVYTQDIKSTKTTMPFYKNNEFDYGKVLKFTGEGL
jgi:hypothetical protein